MIIAVDTAGGDYAPHEVVKGAIKAAEEYKIEIALVGNKSILHVLARRHSKQVGLHIIDANQVISCDESPLKAVRSKPNSSIVVGMNLVRDGAADAFVSAGHTGAVLAAAFLNLGTIEGVERPALGSIINISPSAPALLVDAGANADCRPSHLLQFAQLGNIYAKKLFGTDSPRVGLLSNGEEETKGNRLIQESHQLLKESGLNFIGNVEGQEILNRTVDIIVTDGFTGNIVLKIMEGLSDSFINSLWQVGQFISKANRLQRKTSVRDIQVGSQSKRMDYREYGGACLLGVKGNVIVAHGRSQSKAIKNAIGLAKRTAEQNIPMLIREENLTREVTV